MKRILVIVLGASTLFEFYLAAGVLLRPESMMADFGITALNNEVLYMACIVGWFCLLATLFAGLATFWVYRGKTEGFRLQKQVLALFHRERAGGGA